MAIKLYSEAIDLDPAQDSIFTNRCNAKLETMQWEEALVDAQKVRWYLLSRRHFLFSSHT
jgi:hypothetical protein